MAKYEHLREVDTSSEDSDPEVPLPWSRHKRRRFSWQTVLLVLTGALLAASNVLLLAQNHRLRLLVDGADDIAGDDDHSGFTGIYSRGRTLDQFHTYTAYSDVNRTVSDAAWAGFTTNGFVAVPHADAAAAGLPQAEPFPDDPSKGVYVLSAFHQLHCVIYLRDTVQRLLDGSFGPADDDDGEEARARMVHINHCYDALRQEIQCRADDTPLYAPQWPSRLTGDGQLRRCRDWPALTRWAQEHTACWPTGHCADLKGS